MQHRQRSEPDGLVVRGRDRKIHRSARLVPHGAVSARGHAESVPGRTQIGVESLSAVADVLPLAITTLELYTKDHPFERNESQRRILNPKITNQWREAHLGCG